MDDRLKGTKEDTIVVCGANADDASVAPLAKKFKGVGVHKGLHPGRRLC